MYAGNAAGDAPPTGWLYCNGDTISSTINDGGTNLGGTHYNADGKGNDYQPLFNLLSNTAIWNNSATATWGSDKVKLPDFRSRSPVGIATGAANAADARSTGTALAAGLTSRALSIAAGTETHALTIAELAAHTHASTIVANSTGVTTNTHTHTLSAHTHTSAGHTHAQTIHSHTSAAHTHTTPGSTTGTTDPGDTNATDPGDTNSTTPVAGGGPSNNTTSTHSGHSHGITGVTAYNGTTGVGAPKRTLVEYGTAWANTSTDLSGSHSHNMSSHTHTGAAHVHTMPTHIHTMPTHSHSVPSGTSGSTTPGSTGNSGATATGSTTPGVTGGPNTANTGSTQPNMTDPTHTHTLTAVSTGSGTAHTILSPIIAVNYLIKV